MAIDLGKWLKDRKKQAGGVVAQVNPFDGGKTYDTSQRNVRPGVANPNRPSNNSPGFQLSNNSLTRGLSRGFDQVNPFDNARTWQQTDPTNNRSTISQALDSSKVIVKPFFETADYAKNTLQVPLSSAFGDKETANRARENRDQSYQESILPGINRSYRRLSEVPIIGDTIPGNTARKNVENRLEQKLQEASNVIDQGNRNAAVEVQRGIKSGEYDPAKGSEYLKNLLSNNPANQVLDQVYNEKLQNAGFDKNMSKSRMFASTAGDLASTAGYVISPMSGSSLAKLPFNQALKTGATDVAANSLLGGVGNAASTYGQGGSIGESLKAGGQGAGMNLALMGVGLAKGLAGGRPITPVEVSDLQRFREVAGTGALMDDLTYQKGIAAAQKAGIDYRNPAEVDSFLGDQLTAQVQQQQRAQRTQELRDRMQAAKARILTPLGEGGYVKNPLANDPLETLRQEARNYKSAEEFIDTDKTISVPIRDFSKTDSTSWNEALNNVSRGDLSKTNGPVEVVLTPNGYKLVEGNHRAVQALQSGKDSIEAKVISKEGLDKIAQRDGPHIKMNQQDTLTRQQLIDLYNQANKPSIGKRLGLTGLGEGGGMNAPRNQAEADAMFGLDGRPFRTKPVEAPVQPQIDPRAKLSDRGVAIRPQTEIAPAPGMIGDLPPQSVTVGQARPGGPKTRFADKTVRESNVVSDELKKTIKAPEYTKQTENMGYASALSRLKAEGDDAFTTKVLDALDKKKGTISRQEAIDGTTMAQLLDAKGDELSIRQASEIYEKLSEHYTAAGQTIQAASILSRQSPEGLRYEALKQFKKAGVEVTPEIQTKVTKLIDEVRQTKPQTQERTYAIQKLKQGIAQEIPSTLQDKLTSTWKAGLLTGVRTQTGNALSNTTFSVLHKASDPLAAVIDKGIGAFTDKRTKTLTMKGLASGAEEGFQKGFGKKGLLRTGINETMDATGAKYDQMHEINFKNKAARTYVNGVFRLMGAADKPNRYAQLRNSLNDLAKADGINKGLSGKKLRTYMAQFVSDPPRAALQTATDEAAKAVLANDTLLGSIPKSLRKSALYKNPVGKAVIETTMPFTQVPSAFLSRVIDFTPVGAVKEAVSQIAKRSLDQRTLATAISEATTGTAIIYLGKELADTGQLSGSYPDDPKEQARWKAEGIQPNSIKMGGKWVSMNYLGPVGALFSQGKRISDTKKEGGGNAQIAAGFTSGLAKDSLDQSFLQGVSGAIDAVNDPKRYAENYTKSQISSAIPTLVNDIGTATDPMQRDSNNIKEAVQSRVPGLREKLREKQDVYGNKLSAKADPANSLVNPFRPSEEKTNAVKSEVSRLRSVDETNKDLQVTPTPVDKAVTFDGVKTTLTDKQRYDLQTNIGQATQSAWDKLIKTPEYKKLDDIGKAKALNNLRQDVTSLEQRKFASQNELGQYASNFSGKASKPSAAEVKLATNPETAISNYTKEKSDPSLNKTYKEKYDDALKEFNDPKNGYTPVEKMKKKKELQKLAVQKDYDNDTVSLYGMSNKDVYDYVSNDPEGNAIAQKLFAYDKALYDAGLIDKLKYKNGIAVKKSGGKGGKGGKRSKLTAADFAAATNLTSSSSKALQSLLGGTTVKAPQAKKVAVKKPVLKKVKI